MSAKNNIEQVYHIHKSINTDYIYRFKELLPDGRRLKRLVYHFVDDEHLLKINRAHLDHDYYTDIITFDYSRGERIEGEVWISIDRVKENSSMSSSFEEELKRVCVHGLLHLLGYDDGTDKEKSLMRKLETEFIEKINCFT